jgi:tetratricopeptide (TPR) repeat protein
MKLRAPIYKLSGRRGQAAAGLLVAGLAAGCAACAGPPLAAPAAAVPAASPGRSQPLRSTPAGDLAATMVAERGPSRAGLTVSAPHQTPTGAPPSSTATPTTQSSPTIAATPTPAPPAAVAAALPPGAEGGVAVPPAVEVPATGIVRLPGMVHVYQKWNNCGPSTILMALSAFGFQLDQLEVAAQLKPDREDTNVTPEELADFARRQGLEAIVRYNGTTDIARALLRAGVPVVAEQWIDVHGRGEMGHYRVLMGYDDGASQFLSNDSYYGARRTFGYSELERMWRPFLGAYVAVYRPEQAAAVRAAIGPDWDDDAMWRRALADQAAWVARSPGDAWAWFALGEARARTGDHAGSVAAFDRAIAIGLPFRAFWYQFGYYRALVETGAYDRVVAHADATLQSMKGENLEESHYWRGVALRHLGREEEARGSFERALLFNPLFGPAWEALSTMSGG